MSEKINDELVNDLEATDEEAEQVKGGAARTSKSLKSAKSLKSTKSSKLEFFRQG
jgi:hypothetical protein